MSAAPTIRALMTRRLSLAALTVAVALVFSGACLPAHAAGPGTGSIRIQLVDLTGAPLALAGAVAHVYVSTTDGGGFRYGTTDATGQAVLPELPPSAYYEVKVETPEAGFATYAPIEVDSVNVTAGAATRITMTLAVGATVTGRLTKPDGSPLAQRGVSLEGMGEMFQDASVTTDDSGRYTFVGLKTAVVEIFVGPRGAASSLSWYTSVFAERPGRLPSHISLSTRLVHSSYDLQIGVGVPSDPRSVLGATVRVTNTTTGATFDQRTGGVPGIVQPTKFVVPSGDYSIRVLTVATPATPAQTWWWTGQTSAMSTNPAVAATLSVDYLHPVGAFAQIPQGKP